MAPRDDNSSDSIFLTVIKHATELKVDWHAVAKDTGIKYHNNARTKFNQILKQAGYKLEKDKIIPLADDNNEAGAATPKKRKNTTAGESEESPSQKKKKTANEQVDEE